MLSRRILGIDPGTRLCGWAVLECLPTGQIQRLASGVFRLGSTKPLLERLVSLRQQTEACLQEFKPELVAIEGAYIGRNARSALRLGEARGILMVTVAEAEAELLELPPAVVKRRVAGSGTASKEQIAALVSAQLNIPCQFDSFDESDSLAIALCAALESVDASSHNAATKSGLPPGASPQ